MREDQPRSSARWRPPLKARRLIGNQRLHMGLTNGVQVDGAVPAGTRRPRTQRDVAQQVAVETRITTRAVPVE